jgi:transcription initiation factor IIF auxiliary subunit
LNLVKHLRNNTKIFSQAEKEAFANSFNKLSLSQSQNQTDMAYQPLSRSKTQKSLAKYCEENLSVYKEDINQVKFISEMQHLKKSLSAELHSQNQEKNPKMV